MHHLRRPTIDTLDTNILKGLQTNGRTKVTELSRELGVAQSTLMERVRKLEEQGIIEGYRALINPEKMGLTVQAMIALTLNRHESEVIRRFEDGIRHIPDIRVCYHLTGRFDYLLHVAAKDINELGKLVKTKIAELPGFGMSETFVIFSEIKSDRGWPIESQTVE